MGYYIGCELPKGKAQYLIEKYGASLVATSFGMGDYISRLPEDKALICVIDNGPFEAAGLMYDQKELDVFVADSTGRRKTWLTMDKDLAYELSGYNRGR